MSVYVHHIPLTKPPKTGSSHEASAPECTWSLFSPVSCESLSLHLTLPNFSPSLPPSLPPSECKATGHVELILEIGVTVGVSQRRHTAGVCASAGWKAPRYHVSGGTYLLEQRSPNFLHIQPSLPPPPLPSERPRERESETLDIVCVCN